MKVFVVVFWPELKAPPVSPIHSSASGASRFLQNKISSSLSVIVERVKSGSLTVNELLLIIKNSTDK